MPRWGPLPSLGCAFGQSPGPQSLSAQHSGMRVPGLVLCPPAASPSQRRFRPSLSPQPGLEMRVIDCPDNPPDLLCSSCLGTMGQGSCPRVSTLQYRNYFLSRAAQQPLHPDRSENVERHYVGDTSLFHYSEDTYLREFF